MPWEAQSGRRGLSGGKIALIVVAALVAVAVLLVGALVLARGLAGGGVPFSGDAPFAYGDDAVLDELWDRCEGGDGEACDDLFWDSPVDSEYEEFGNTCGGRFEDGPWSCEQEL